MKTLMLNNPLRHMHLLDLCFIKLPNFSGNREAWQNLNMALQSKRLPISKDDIISINACFLHFITNLYKVRGDGKNSRAGFQSPVTCIFLNQQSIEPKKLGIWV